MILNRLEMYNFRQFIGKQSIEFSTDPEKNVTVLIGINTSGKTTIVRAFEWCLYGKNGFEDPVLLNSNVRANMNVGDTQKAWVAVTFTHDGKEYTLTRTHKYVCNERRRIPASSEYEVDLNKKPVEELTLEYLQSDGQTKTPIDRSDITDSMDRVLPRDLSDYFFFGGERISGIANRADLSKAVRGLMRLDILENARGHLHKVLKSFEDDIDTSGDANAEKAKNALETYKNKLKMFEDDKDNADREMQYWNNKEKEYNAELAKSNIDQVKKAKNEREHLEKAIELEKRKYASEKKALVDAFNTRAFVFFGKPAIKESLEFLEDVKDAVEIVPGKADYEQASQHIGSCKENIKNCENAIEKYAKSSKKNERIARMITYSKAVYDWLDETYQSKEKTVRFELQRRVNDNFKKMYHGDRSIMIDDKYRVAYSDIKTEESDGLKAVKSFAFIAGLVSMAKDKILDDQDLKLGQEYPLVMDAPFSNVDEIHIDNICRILPHTANQIVMAVMKKDWDYAVGNLDQFVGKSFSIAKDTDVAGREIDSCVFV